MLVSPRINPVRMSSPLRLLMQINEVTAGKLDT
jgi:hypothetical protein